MTKMVFFAIALATSVSYARMAPIGGQQSKTPTPRYTFEEPGFASKGFRVGVMKAPADVAMTFKVDEFSRTTNMTMGSSAGFTIGYAYLPVRSFGFTTNLAWMELKKDNSSVNLVRIDGNGAFAFTNSFYGRVGLNLSKFATGGSENSDIKKLDPKLGIQAGVGFQITQNFGIDLSYVQMKQGGTLKEGDFKADIETVVSGSELALTGTF